MLLLTSETKTNKDMKSGYFSPFTFRRNAIKMHALMATCTHQIHKMDLVLLPIFFIYNCVLYALISALSSIHIICRSVSIHIYTISWMFNEKKNSKEKYTIRILRRTLLERIIGCIRSHSWMRYNYSVLQIQRESERIHKKKRNKEVKIE